MTGEEGPLVGDRLADALAEQRVSHTLSRPRPWPPSARHAGSLPHLRTLIVGAEACPPDLVAQWAPGRSRMINSYGPTEATVVATWTGPLSPGAPPPSEARPAPRASTSWTRPCAPSRPGVTGELYVAGPGSPAAYLNQPGLTAQRFLADPFGGPGERMYRTGDLAVWAADGQLRFAGRADDQVNCAASASSPARSKAHCALPHRLRDAAVVVRTPPTCHDPAGQADQEASAWPEGPPDTTASSPTSCRATADPEKPAGR
ncbi:hypothetical protein SMD44_08958 [Streptomyces alboflavus]|uniref:AMP-dependent synthetase/ligase domain-containing protein n=1 Tax=Streptomyces alboflavus TaxID=67267 RepID=A0A1Z1WSP8_9ACTN|nr:AMP-binding protein [Streptomyces alboflavus]ARX89471.1 hypothetical protein SMD44_08958 [Streptomyces alboflavus]